MKNLRRVFAMIVTLAMVLTLLPANLAVAAAPATTLKTTDITVQVKKTAPIVLFNKNYSNTYTFTSSNKKVATVDTKGVVKGVKAGTAKITVKETDKAKKTKTLGTVNVKVEAAPKAPSKGTTYNIDLSTVLYGTYDEATKSVTAKDTEFQFPLQKPLLNGQSFTVHIKGKYNGHKGFRMWLIDEQQVTLSNIADTSVFPKEPKAFDVTFKFTSTGNATFLFFKGATYDDPNVDDVTVTSVTITY